MFDLFSFLCKERDLSEERLGDYMKNKLPDDGQDYGWRMLISVPMDLSSYNSF